MGRTERNLLTAKCVIAGRDTPQHNAFNATRTGYVTGPVCGDFTYGLAGIRSVVAATTATATTTAATE